MFKLLFVAFIVLSGCHHELPETNSAAGNQSLAGANLCVTCNNNEKVIKPLGYGDFIIEERDVLWPQRLCSESIKNVEVIYKSTHFRTKWQKNTGEIRSSDWQTTGADEKHDALREVALIRGIRIKAIANTEPKPSDEW